MQTTTSFLRFSKWVLFMVFLVIIAGAIVRMTQSGMGCPDWPKCFGKWIPPTSAADLPADYEKYLKKQDIDHTFNVFHTWTEYINRLLGALLGLFLFIQVVWSVKFWKQSKQVTLLCISNVLLTGFQAWLGKQVVTSNLATFKITAHMLVALLIAAIALTVIQQLSKPAKVHSKKIFVITLLALILLVIQIVLGTQVREQVDWISKEFAYTNREQWISRLDYLFLVHRSFSVLVALFCLYGVYLFKKQKLFLFSHKIIILSLFAEIILGVIMAYFAVPPIAQPLHLLFSCTLFGGIYYSLLTVSTK